jgi:hypothetical protein
MDGENESFSIEQLEQMEGETNLGYMAKQEEQRAAQAPEPKPEPEPEPEIEEEPEEELKESDSNEEILEADAEEVEDDEEAEADEEEDEQLKPKYSEKQLSRKMEKRVRTVRKQEAEKRAQLEERMADLQVEMNRLQQQYGQQQPLDEDASLDEKVRRAFREEHMSQKQEDLQEQMRRTRMQMHDNMMRLGKDKYPDYEERVNNAKYTEEILEAVDLMPNKEDLMYELAVNQDIVYDLVNLPVREQARRIASLSHKIGKREKPKPKRSTGAPPPVKRLEGGSRETVKQDDYLSRLENMEVGELFERNKAGTLYD